MTTIKKDLNDDLNILIEKNYDAEEGYKKASEIVKAPELKRLLETFAVQRYGFGHDIKGRIVELGGDIERGTSSKADIHREWMDLKATLSSDTDEAVIEECVRGEKRAMKSYEAVLENDFLTEDMVKLLRDHLAKVKESLYLLEELEEQV